MAKKSVQPPEETERRPLRGRTVGERIGDALEQSGLSKSEAGRRITGRPDGYLYLHRWIQGNGPQDKEHLRKLAEVLGVTLDELLGVAVGQAPPYAAWEPFVAMCVQLGTPLSEEEWKSLASVRWLPDSEPSVETYLALRAVLRGATRH